MLNLPGIKFNPWHCTQTVDKNTDQDGSHYGEPDGGRARLMHPLLKIDQSKYDGRQAAWAKPAHEQQGSPAQPGTDKRNCHRQHPHHRQA